MSQRPARPGGLSRRAFLGGVAAAAGLGATGLTGCSSVGAGIAGTRVAPGTVSFWNLFGGGDGLRMQAMEAAYRKANPRTGLEAVTFNWGDPYYTKLSLATLGDKPPDVAVAHLSRMKNLQAAGLLQELKPEDLARHGMTPDKFNAKAWQAGLVDGKAYAFPLDTHPLVLFYNTKICKKAGLLDTDGKLKPVDGPDAFAEMLERGQKASGKYGGAIAVNGDPATGWRWFNTLYAQQRGQVLADEGTKIVLDDDKAAKALDYMRTLTLQKKLMPANIDYGGAIALFADGQSAFFLQGEWEITTFQTAKTPFSMAPVPNVFGTGGYTANFGDSHTLVLPRWPDADPDRLDRALAFVRTMLDQSYTWAEGGHIPAWLPVRDSAKYQKLEPQSDYAVAANRAVYDPPAWYSGAGSSFENIMGFATAAAEAGQLSTAGAIASMRSKLRPLTQTAPPT